MLSKKAKYAIKALIFLAKNLDKPPMPVSKISELEKIPKKYLEVILLDLRNAGYLFSKKGVDGGYVLNKLPEEIILVGVVRLMDGPIARVSCASAYHYHNCEECLDEATCSIRKVYLKIREEELKILSNTSISDMINYEQLVDHNPVIADFKVD
ncbi:BadM/Rrf2 family transcriptional regulator [Mucilaginibacter frigoritolerans]|jgi:Rrf2 family protein|uniref:BadM/Rrf2 family transcriptional regulator n=1 Tax=Mucilaginibacter frigoritolerans TaxID=652788 RepID=A0A562TVB9_9SPHI|nr:Rrf2 family transcriptional regulator [Mucilaginibacter frigoritolerans]TWI97559.1 BadM/Rrf2 family transcriptional regulator [Mucilaginibacter frigoritolerans]